MWKTFNLPLFSIKNEHFITKTYELLLNCLELTNRMNIFNECILRYLTDTGMSLIRFYSQKGEYLIGIDNNIPVKMIKSKENQNDNVGEMEEIFATGHHLIEKALAKYFGNYDILKSIYLSDCLFALCGFYKKKLYLSKSLKNNSLLVDELWITLNSSITNPDMITICRTMNINNKNGQQHKRSNINLNLKHQQYFLVKQTLVISIYGVNHQLINLIPLDKEEIPNFSGCFRKDGSLIACSSKLSKYTENNGILLTIQEFLSAFKYITSIVDRTKFFESSITGIWDNRCNIGFFTHQHTLFLAPQYQLNFINNIYSKITIYVSFEQVEPLPCAVCVWKHKTMGPIRSNEDYSFVIKPLIQKNTHIRLSFDVDLTENYHYSIIPVLADLGSENNFILRVYCSKFPISVSCTYPDN
eukprot:TRINITY_DN3179_c0_g2_i1.p1 TRINITY_DN3179_c0_g2~~TRINITY_DN3179_c0_g2_i1.p1  ORF type:complete len:414 (+),score=84.82 TRINITY_DN3179_c0_g2_i1:3-1244(+)